MEMINYCCQFRLVAIREIIGKLWALAYVQSENLNGIFTLDSYLALDDILISF